MRILLDVDGVCADFMGGLRAQLKGTFDPSTYDIWKHMLPSQATDARRALAREPFWYDLVPIAGAVDGVDAFRQAGHEVVWVTTPYRSCRAWCAIRYEWLRQWFDAGPDSIVFTSAKHLVGGKVFVDDNPENVLKWGQQHFPAYPYLFDQPYNMTAPMPYRVDWDFLTRNYGPPT